MPVWMRRVPLWSLPIVGIVTVAITDWLAGAVAVLAVGAVAGTALLVAVTASPLVTRRAVRATAWAAAVPLLVAALTLLAQPAVQRTIEPGASAGRSQAGTQHPAPDLRGKVLRTADLSNRNLREAVLDGAHMDGVDLPGRTLDRARLVGSSLRGADLRAASLTGTRAAGADLRGADLRGAAASDIDLRGADLRGADFRGADLIGAHLDGACLRQTRFDGANLDRASARGADAVGASLLPPALAAQTVSTPGAPDACAR